MPQDNDKSATGNKQSDFAGTNPDRYGQPADDQDNPEAQNVTDGTERMSGDEATDARNKANEGSRQGRDE